MLSLGLLPDEDTERLSARYATVVAAIHEQTGFDAKLVLPDTYLELVDLFAEGKVDAAYFGGYTFVLAADRHGAVPLVMRDIDARFVSQVVVHRDSSTLHQLSDLRGARFAFGSRQSTSGHVMPRHHFVNLGIQPEEFFGEVMFSGAHDRTVRLVADGTVDAGVANGQIVRRLLENGDGGAPPVRIIWQSPPFVNYVWAAQPSMTEQTRRAITEVFLSLSRDDPTQREFLDSVGARYYLPASMADFVPLRHALQEVAEAAAKSP